MARGNGIYVEGPENYKGKHWTVIVGAGLTLYPGYVVQIDPSVAVVGGRFTVIKYNVAADGSRPSGPYIVLLDDNEQGKTADITNSANALAAGAMVKGYTPLPGDEINLVIANIAGTGDDHTKGEVLIVDDTTGLMIATTGSPETEPAMLLETITDPTADTLAWCVWSGY